MRLCCNWCLFRRLSLSAFCNFTEYITEKLLLSHLLSYICLFHAIWKPRAVCRLHRAVCRLHAMQSADCAATVSMGVLWRDNFKENRENCHDFIVLYCVRNWEGISVVENLVRHNNRSFRANKLVIVSPNYKQENE